MAQRTVVINLCEAQILERQMAEFANRVIDILRAVADLIQQVSYLVFIHWGYSLTRYSSPDISPPDGETTR